MKISELIEALTAVKKDHGDIPVILSSDEEGNCYSTLHFKSISVDEDEKGKAKSVILYPWASELDRDDLEL